MKRVAVGFDAAAMGGDILNFSMVRDLIARPLASIVGSTAESTSNVISGLPIGEVIDILGIVTDKLLSHLDFMMMNKKQMRTLAERISAVVLAIKGLPVNPAGQKKYAEPLARLTQTIFECGQWVVKYGDKNLIVKFLNSRTHHIKFEDLYARLANHVQDLQLGLNVQEWFDVARQKAERALDLEALSQNQGALLAMIRESTERFTDHKLQGSERAKLIDKKMGAIEEQLHALLSEHADRQAGSGEKASRFLEEALLIDYCDIELEENIGSGSFGTIYRGRYGEESVVIKEVDAVEEGPIRDEFLREVKIMSTLRSPYIIPLYGVCVHPKRSCYVMEAMEGGNLWDYLQKRGSLIPSARHQLALDIALGLVYLESQGVLHRDLKPENILVNGRGHAKLADFGLADVARRSDLPPIPAGKSSEAFRYLAPEVLSGSAYTRKSEVYSYGMILWVILTGSQPYGSVRGDVIRHVVRGGRETIPGGIEQGYRDLLLGCWEELPFKRPSLSGICGALRRLVPGVSTVGVPLVSDSKGVDVSELYPTGPRVPSEASESSYQKALALVFQGGDPVVARQLLVESSDAGHTRARTDLGLMYLKGMGGLVPDRALACQLLQQSAVEGHVRAMQVLSAELERGEDSGRHRAAINFWRQQAAEATRALAVSASTLAESSSSAQPAH